ncbi:TraB/GumN family protein [Altererythrobacter sp. KTW20L]|uniref:TraB/GumN family protein n=1 Tax=Altererythrobacter sp. KTW20L TaxID=2942210 RepID=UPI0020C07D65|nr:TraB/GumN family protein [Altererythrobacter sp. KTW20L]MCL6251988.1 TraB/GumN family protein [Altererythrobacter sp. KTW20L]
MNRIVSALALAALSLAMPLASPVAAQEAPALPPALVQNYDPAPAMWKLADEDTTIYLLGTVHLLPEGFRWRNPQLDAIVGEVEELVLESSDADAAASIAALDGKFLRLLESRPPTSAQLAPAARSKWRRLVEQQGLFFEEVDRLPLVVALMGFGMGGEETGLSSYEYGVETVLEAEFAASGRPVSSIEDTGRVMMSLYRIDDNLLLRDLERDLIRWDGRSASMFLGLGETSGEDNDWELEHAWARGELQETIDLGMSDTKAGVAFHRALLTNRNRRWATWLEDRLDEPGTILVAVGAAHFEGNDSVLVRLQELGLVAERLN